ncbi:hypothetical protein Hanom_Chr05g00475211 [Helianthus anomalus]
MPYLLLAYGAAYFACSIDDDDDDYVKNLNKSSSVSVFTYLGRFLVPLLLVLVLYVPKSINWIVDSILYLSLWIEVTHFLIFFFFFNKLVINKKRTTKLGSPT